MKLVHLISLIGKSLSDPNKSLKFYEKIFTSEQSKLGKEALVCLEMEISISKVSKGLLNEAKDILDRNSPIIDQISPSESLVFSKFHQANSVYYRVTIISFLIN